MKIDVKHKMYMGIGRFFIPVPQLISARGLKKGVSGAKAKADLLSEEERKIHHFIVKKLTVTQKHITTDIVGEALDVPVNSVEKIVDKLEAMKTFLYRSDGKGIDWAYPLSLEDTGHEITVSTGERFFAA